MVKQIFVGGWWGSGTRAIQYLLRQTHNTGSDLKNAEGNVQEDYELGLSDPHDHIIENLLRGECAVFGKLPPEPWSMKSGDFMLVIPELKSMFPESKFILIIRHGVDQILNHRGMDIRYDKYFQYNKPKNFLERRMSFWSVAYQFALQNADIVIKLEDLCEKPDEIADMLSNELGIPKPDTSEIITPKSIGKSLKAQKIKSHDYNENMTINYNPKKQRPKLLYMGEPLISKFNYE